MLRGEYYRTLFERANGGSKGKRLLHSLATDDKLFEGLNEWRQPLGQRTVLNKRRDFSAKRSETPSNLVDLSH